MLRWSTIARRLRALVARDDVEREMADELRFHMEMEAQHRERQGVEPAAAMLAAKHAFVGVEAVKEAYRDARGIRPLEDLMQDIRYAIRGLLRHRIFTITAVLTFAIGLGAMTSILTLVNAAWFSWSSAFTDADRLVMVFKTWPTGSGPTSPYDLRDWQRDVKSLSGLAAYMRYGVRVVPDGGKEPLAIGAAATTANLWNVLALRPALGRFYRTDEEQWGRNSVAVLSHQTWQQRFGGDPTIIGRRVTIDDAPVEIVGVAPRGSWFSGSSPDVFVPYAFAPDDPRNARHSHFVLTVGRLAAGASLEQARTEMRGIASRIAQVNAENEGTTASVEPLSDVMLGDVTPTLRMLLGAVVLVLIIACANVANLLLVRGAARSREIAVRAALGASVRRIAQQLLTESVILAVIGGALGALLATVIVRALSGSLPLELPRVADTGIQLDWRITLACLAIVLASGVVCGLLPSIQLARSADALREGSRSVSGGRRAGRVRSALVVGQVAVALVLLVTSGLFVFSLRHLQREDAGVRADNVLSVRLSLSRAKALDSVATVRFYDDVIRRVAAVPGVRTVGVTSNLPLTGGGETKSFYIEGREPATLAEVPSVVGRMESAASLQTVGATLVRGRWFAETDRAGAPNVAIIAEGVARRFFKNGEDPIGKRIALHPPEALYPASRLPPGGKWPRWTVIGVVKDVKYQNPRMEPELAVYVNYPQGKQVWNWGPQWLVARTEGRPAESARAIRVAMRESDASMPLDDMLPLTDRMAQSLRAPKFTAGLITTFALVAVMLGVVGLYGVIAYAVSQETRSFGVRIALGATPSDVSRAVLTRGVRLAAIGIVVGSIGAFFAARAIGAQLYGVRPVDPLTYGAACLVLFVLTLVASYFPARRAARVDPLLALRAD